MQNNMSPIYEAKKSCDMCKNNPSLALNNILACVQGFFVRFKDNVAKTKILPMSKKLWGTYQKGIKADSFIQVQYT